MGTQVESHLQKKNTAQFSAAVAVPTVPIFIPPGTWVDRGGVKSKLAQGFYIWPVSTTGIEPQTLSSQVQHLNHSATCSTAGLVLRNASIYCQSSII